MPLLTLDSVFEEGKEILPPFQTPVGRVGLMICFDVSSYSMFSSNLTSIITQLRYPEVPLSLKRQGAQIITYPSACTIPTGKAHWEILLRARAIETQSYVIAAAQAGHNNETRVTYGHSIVVDPWGNIVAELGGDFEGPQIATATIDLSLVERIRKEVPLVRRTDVYLEL
jgi:predicted amidohydrolase